MATTKAAIGFEDAPRDLARDADLGRLNTFYQFALRQGQPQLLFEFYDSLIAREAVLESATELRTAGVAAAHVSVIPGDKNELAKQNRERFVQAFNALDIDSLLRQAARGIPVHGVHASEIFWIRDGAEWRWDSLAPVIPTALAWTVPRTSAMGLTVAGLPPNTWLIRTGPARWEPLRQDKWVIIPRHDSGTPANFALMRASSVYTLFAIGGFKSWIAFVDRYGLPVPEIQLNAQGDPDLKKMAEEILANWGQKGFISTQDDAIKVIIHDAAAMSRVGSSDVQERLLKQLQNAIDRQWNGGGLVQGMGTGAGSYSLGQVHEGAQAKLYGSDARRIASGLQRCLVEPYFRINNIEGPQPRIQIITPAEVAQILSRIGYLAQNGYFVADLQMLSQWIGLEITRETLTDAVEPAET